MSTATFKDRQLLVNLDEELLSELHFDENTPLTVRCEQGHLVVESEAAVAHSEFARVVDEVFDEFDSDLKRLAE